MSGTSTKAMADGPTGWDVPKQRNCLRCRTSFRSEWSGDRVCSRCKHTKAWKDGNSLRSGATHTGR